eukprot:1191054-Prorocentrum_minimum.AAC.5
MCYSSVCLQERFIHLFVSKTFHLAVEPLLLVGVDGGSGLVQHRKHRLHPPSPPSSPPPSKIRSERSVVPALARPRVVSQSEIINTFHRNSSEDCIYLLRAERVLTYSPVTPSLLNESQKEPIIGFRSIRRLSSARRLHRNDKDRARTVHIPGGSRGGQSRSAGAPPRSARSPTRGGAGPGQLATPPPAWRARPPSGTASPPRPPRGRNPGAAGTPPGSDADTDSVKRTAKTFSKACYPVSSL